MIQLVMKEHVFICQLLVDLIKMKIILEPVDPGICKTLHCTCKIQNPCPLITVIPENKCKRKYFHQQEKKKEMIPNYEL
jgi:hypothetical protein